MTTTYSPDTKNGFKFFWLTLLGCGSIVPLTICLAARLPAPEQFNSVIGQKLTTLTDNWERLSAVPGGSLIGADGAIALLPAGNTQVSADVLTIVYDDCNALRERERTMPSATLYPAYAKELDEVAQACSTMGRLVARNAFTYGQFRNIATLQRTRNTAASVQIESERAQAVGVDAKEKQKADAARQNMLALRNWREEAD